MPAWRTVDPVSTTAGAARYPPASRGPRPVRESAASPRRAQCRPWRLLGLLCLAEEFQPDDGRFIDAFTQVLPASVSDTAQAAVGVSGLLLLRMAAGLRRGRVREW